jgi:hypothetical protein
MALHTALPIDKAAHDLFVYAIVLARNFPRDVKKLVGERLVDICLSLKSLVYLANKAGDKLDCLDELLLRQVQVETLLRISRDMRFISPEQYGKAIKLTSTVGRQASNWRRKYVPTPAP